MIVDFKIQNFRQKSFIEILALVKNKIKNLENKMQEYYELGEVYSQMFDAYTTDEDAVYSIKIYGGTE